MSLILIVDDMALIRELLNASLRNAGYETAFATDGHQALAAVTARVPDLILLDVSMPGMGGLEVLEALRAAPANCQGAGDYAYRLGRQRHRNQSRQVWRA